MCQIAENKARVRLQSRVWRLFTEDRKERKEEVSDNWSKPSAWLFATFVFFCCKLLLIGRPSLVVMSSSLDLEVGSIALSHGK